MWNKSQDWVARAKIRTAGGLYCATRRAYLDLWMCGTRLLISENPTMIDFHNSTMTCCTAKFNNHIYCNFGIGS